MPIGAFTRQFDLPLLLVDLFVLFFFCLVYYLRREDKREGYPLVSHRSDRTGGRIEIVGFPAMPPPKIFHRPHGLPPVEAPHRAAPEILRATNVGNPTGMPIEPIGDPLLSGIGPASWVEKEDEPDLNHQGEPVFQPLRIATGFHVMKGDADPRGFAVLGCDKREAGRVIDLWIDKAEHRVRFYELQVDPAAALPPAPVPAAETTTDVIRDVIEETPDGLVETIETRTVTRRPLPQTVPAGPPPEGRRRVLLPAEFAAVDGRRRTVRTAAITAAQFARVPTTRDADTVTAREENKIRGYFGGGHLWGLPGRAEPLL